MALSLVGSAENSSTGSGGVTITFPGGVAENDVVYVFKGVNTAIDVDMALVTSGYTELADLRGNDSEDINFGAYRKVMGATPDSSVDIGTGFADQGNCGVLHVWRGVDTTTPEDATTTTAVGTNSAVPDSPSITTVTDTAVVLSAGGSGVIAGAGDSAVTVPTNYINKINNTNGGTNGAVNMMVASREIATAGAENPGAWSGITTANSASWAACTIAIRPAAGGGGSPVSVTPITLALVTQTFAPTVLTPRLVTPGTLALATELFAPTVTIGTRLTPGIAELVLASFAPTVRTPRLVTPTTAELALAFFAPTVTGGSGVTRIPGTLALNLTTFAPIVRTPRLVTPATAELAVTTFAPSVQTPILVTPQTLALLLTLFAPTVVGDVMEADVVRRGSMGASLNVRRLMRRGR